MVQALVDDGLVDTDKIGTSVYFWAFPRWKNIHNNIIKNWLVKLIDSFAKFSINKF